MLKYAASGGKTRMIDNELIIANNLTKIYGDENNKVTALDHVSFSIARGEFVSIVGTSGSGKSTLLNIISG